VGAILIQLVRVVLEVDLGVSLDLVVLAILELKVGKEEFQVDAKLKDKVVLDVDLGVSLILKNKDFQMDAKLEVLAVLEMNSAVSLILEVLVILELKVGQEEFQV